MSARADTKIKRPAITKVTLKTSSSRPLLEEEVERPPQTLPNPVPRTCIRIKPESETARITCRTKKIFIAILYLKFTS
jgi:hypothetical protein